MRENPRFFERLSAERADGSLRLSTERKLLPVFPHHFLREC
jgi:hypothetical protein